MWRPGCDPHRTSASPAAWCRPDSRRPAGRRQPRRCRPTGMAGPGRCRMRGWPPRQPRTCRTGRCTRSETCPVRPGRTCRAGKPSRWVSPPPPKQPTLSRPCRCCERLIAWATRFSASSHVAGLSGASRRSRPRGAVSRSGCSSNSAAVHPLLHSPPRLVGISSCGVRWIRSGATRKAMPHCSEQYGQCVGVGRSSTPLPCACRVSALLSAGVTAESEVGSSYRLRGATTWCRQELDRRRRDLRADGTATPRLQRGCRCARARYRSGGSRLSWGPGPA